MKTEWECGDIIRCLPEDDGCHERVWLHYQKCMEIEETVEYQAEEAFVAHVPVDTGGQLPFAAVGVIMFIVGMVLIFIWPKK